MGPDGLHVTCTCGTVLHLHLTCGTRWLTCHLTLAVHHKSLRSVLSPSDVYLWDPFVSDLWDPTTYVSCVPVGSFSISIRPVGPDGLHATCACGPFSIQSVGSGGTFLHLHRPMGPNGLRVTCTCRTLLHLHSTYGTRQLVDPSPSNLWDPTAYVSRDPTACVSLVDPSLLPGLNKSKLRKP